MHVLLAPERARGVVRLATACARSSPAACGTRSTSAFPPTTIDMPAHPTVKGVTGDWLETDFAARFRDHDPEAGHRQVTLDELVDGELATIHAQLVDGGSPPKAAAKYLAGWFGGRAGRSPKFAVLAADARVQLEAHELRQLAVSQR